MVLHLESNREQWGEAQPSIYIFFLHSQVFLLFYVSIFGKATSWHFFFSVSWFQFGLVYNLNSHCACFFSASWFYSLWRNRTYWCHSVSYLLLWCLGQLYLLECFRTPACWCQHTWQQTSLKLTLISNYYFLIQKVSVGFIHSLFHSFNHSCINSVLAVSKECLLSYLIKMRFSSIRLGNNHKTNGSNT